MKNKTIKFPYGNIYSHDYYVEEIMGILSNAKNDGERKEILKTLKNEAFGFDEMFEKLSNPNEKNMCLTEEEIDEIIAMCSNPETPTGAADARLHLLLSVHYMEYNCDRNIRLTLLKQRLLQEFYMLSDMEMMYLKDYLLGKPIKYAELWNEVK